MSLKSWIRKWLFEPTGEALLPLINANLGRYESTLGALGDAEADEAVLLAALIQRDQIASTLAKQTATPKMVRHLASLDRQLRQAAPRILNTDWEAWRQALNPPLDRWWWRLDETQTQAEKKRDFPLDILTSLFWAIALSVAVDIIRRVWSGGLDTVSVLGTILTLVVSGSPLTKQARELAGWLMDKAKLPQRWRGETMLGAAFLALCGILLLRLVALPAVAVTCNNLGYALLQADDLTGAQRAFARAVSINHDYAAGYYNLADAYVQVGDYEQSCSLYRKALAADRTLDLAYNGLGYVLILQGKPEQAIPILYTGLDLVQEDTVRAALWTNLGRAYLEAKRYHEAKTALTEALALAPEEAAAHCTLAQTAEALGRPEDEIIQHWEDCLRYAPTVPRGRELAAMARSHLQQLEEDGQ